MPTTTTTGTLLYYDAAKRRLWIAGQRCHHGATGCVLATFGAAGLIAARLSPRGTATVALMGSLLMLHDWHDREMWFERGWGTQP